MKFSTMAQSSTLLRCAQTSLARPVLHTTVSECCGFGHATTILSCALQFWNLYELLDIWCFAKAIWTMGTYHELSMDVAEHIMLEQNQRHYLDMMASGGIRAAYRTMKVRQSGTPFVFKLTALDIGWMMRQHPLHLSNAVRL